MSALFSEKVPREWSEREKLREKGQFWTPAWVAEAMVSYISPSADVIFDPCAGKGSFYAALKKLAPGKKFYGMEIDNGIVLDAQKDGVFDRNAKIDIGDFVLNPPQARFKGIVANPPYVRHHRISQKQKECFRNTSLANIGDTLDGRAGLHIYFLVQALTLLDKGGRLAFIVPADTCEGVFSRKLWAWISEKFFIDGIVTFDHTATPFPGIDTNAVILLIKNERPKKKLKWARCINPKSGELAYFLKNNLPLINNKDIIVYDRDLSEALSVGFSREPQIHQNTEFTLSSFARVSRGIATGANDFFFLTKKRADELKIPRNFLLPAIGRTRDVEGAYITNDAVKKLDEKGRPTQLFYPNSMSFESMPDSVKNYIVFGERMGLPNRPLISTRRPWFKMESRKIPPFLFAYLGRRNTRFVKNDAGVVPLTGFLCVYPHTDDPEFVDKLWCILQHPTTLSNIQLVGKSYGSGAIKVEPRSLDKLPISTELINEIGIKPMTIFSQRLFA